MVNLKMTWGSIEGARIIRLNDVLGVAFQGEQYFVFERSSMRVLEVFGDCSRERAIDFADVAARGNYKRLLGV